MIHRRSWLVGASVLVAARPAPAAGGLGALGEGFARIERARGGRLGVAVLDMATGEAASHRAAERFPMASTFKLLLAGAVLARVDRGEERLDRALAVPRELVPWSPVTGTRAGGELGIAALVEAIVTMSDNTATNLLLDSIGGPAGLTGFLRTRLADDVTRSDRPEPALNEARPGDERDTTSPAAFLASMRKLTLGDALTPASRERLVLLMKASQTSARLLRARLSLGWQVADRTGAGGHRTANVVALLWPPRRAEPVLLAAFLTEGPEARGDRDATLIEVGGAVAAALGAPMD